MSRQRSVARRTLTTNASPSEDHACMPPSPSTPREILPDGSFAGLKRIVSTETLHIVLLCAYICIHTYTKYIFRQKDPQSYFILYHNNLVTVSAYARKQNSSSQVTKRILYYQWIRPFSKCHTIDFWVTHDQSIQQVNWGTEVLGPFRCTEWHTMNGVLRKK